VVTQGISWKSRRLCIGYFIESAINHYTLSGGRTNGSTMPQKKLADCWVANIGPGKKEWYDGHEEMDRRLGGSDVCNDMEAIITGIITSSWRSF